jgi:translation initiation factor 2 subunit 1
VLEKAVEAIGAEIRLAKGELVVKVKPRAISAQDEKLLHSLMQTLERQNEEIGGDSDEEADVEGMGNLKIAE